MIIIGFITYMIIPSFLVGLYFYAYIYSLHDFLDPYNISIITGAFAYILFMSQLIFAARLPFLERRISQNQLIKIHSQVPVAIFTLLAVHGGIKIYFLIDNEGASPQVAMGSLAFLLFIVLGIQAYRILLGKARKGSDKGDSPPYDKVKKNHNLLVLAAILSTLHVVFASSTWSIALKVYILSWACLTMATFLWHKAIRPRKSTPLTLTGIESLAPDVNKYYFTSENHDIQRDAGQFAYFNVKNSRDQYEEHPFTISSSPGRGIELIMRESGDFTRKLKDFAIGSQFYMDGPYGHFTLNDLPLGVEIVFLVAGIGITPVMSIALDENLSGSNALNIIWSIHNSKEKIVAKDLQNQADEGRIKFYTHISSQEGRINKEDILNCTGFNPSKKMKYAWFICGPPNFSTSMLKILKEWRIPQKLIIDESFSW